MNRPGSLRADLALGAVTLIWGSTFIVNAKVIEREPPLAYLMVRFALALVPLLWLSSRRLKTPGLLRDTLVMGPLLALGMASQIAGQTETSASKTAFITGLSVVLTPFFALFRTRALPRLGNLVGVTVASAGFFLLTWPSGGGPINRGDLMVTACAFFFAVYIVENAERAPRHDAIVFTTAQLAAACACLGLLSAWLRLFRPGLGVTPFEARPLVFDRGFLLAVAYMASFATVITFTVQTWAQTRMSATHTAILFTLEPVWTVIFAAIFLGERWTPRAAAGGALVIAGILVSEIRRGEVRAET
jgi:drug/metabolite transporter (DMT)-like permease